MCLQLDIENSHVKRLDDALRLYFEPESLEGYTLESTKETIEAKKHCTLDKLPRVLILNLKRFAYNPETQACSKISKQIDYPEELLIHLNFLSSQNIAPTREQRSYKLTAVRDAHSFCSGFGCFSFAAAADLKSVSMQCFLSNTPVSATTQTSARW